MELENKDSLCGCFFCLAGFPSPEEHLLEFSQNDFIYNRKFPSDEVTNPNEIQHCFLCVTEQDSEASHKQHGLNEHVQPVGLLAAAYCYSACSCLMHSCSGDASQYRSIKP
ncbi:hypothetical protein CHARACLAT_029388 [Characodon lateralis]|uniref:Uncharacterized protein n=1 Tax=Characodon lateralis TaxID=208331 RepID=A0ABU7EE23_9TELE|nr:hypothetical protein [Characodon lateralis]